MIVNSKNFEAEVLKFNGIVLVDFWATWCGPCLMQAPILEELATDFKDDKTIKIVKLDTDENPDISQKYQIMSIPNLKFFKNGELVAELVGLQGKQNILNVIQSLSK